LTHWTDTPSSGAAAASDGPMVRPLPGPTVLHLRASGGLFGADRVVLDLCAGLAASGYRAILMPITETGGGAGAELRAAGVERGIPVRPLPMASRVDWKAVARLRHLAAIEGASILHGHDYKANTLIRLAAIEGARWVATLHGRVGTDWKLRLYEALETRLIRRCDRVVCVSETMCAAEAAHGLTPVVIHNGIDLAPFRGASMPSPELRAALGLPEDAEVIGSIGRLSAEKGYENLLRAAARLVPNRPRLHLLLVGDGPERRSLVDLAAALGIADRVHLPGIRRDAPLLYRLFTIFCLTSHREGLPLALLEALASGCAAVVTPVGGIPEVLGNSSGNLMASEREAATRSQGNAGGEPSEVSDAAAITVPPGDIASLTSVLARLLDDPDRRARLGAAGRARVEAHFSRAEMVGATARLYDDLLGRGSTDSAGRGVQVGAR
jgi:glycosyltransferase involved in cell wall biosynthesis